MPHETIGAELQTVLAVIKVLVLFLGVTITYFSYQAYRRTQNRSLGYLTLGFATVTFGAVIGGVTFEIINQPLAIGVIIEGVFFLLGFLFIAYSLQIE